MSKKRLIWGLAILFFALCSFTSCNKTVFRGLYAEDNRFVYFLFYPSSHFAVSDQPNLEPYMKCTQGDLLPFKMKEENGGLVSKSYLQICGFCDFHVPASLSVKYNDNGYYRKIDKKMSIASDRKSKQFNKYYIPKQPMYWKFVSLSITSNNASFGADYPPGSDLTPLFTFRFPSLKEFIEKGYRGDFTAEHVIRADNADDWAALELFENVPTFRIDRVPTTVIGDEAPTITINLHYINKAVWDNHSFSEELREEKEFNPKVTLRIEIER